MGVDGSVQLRLEYLLGDQPNKPRVVQLVLMSNRLPKIHRLRRTNSGCEMRYGLCEIRFRLDLKVIHNFPVAKWLGRCAGSALGVVMQPPQFTRSPLTSL